MNRIKFTLLISFSLVCSNYIFGQPTISDNQKQLAEEMFIFCRMTSVVQNNSFNIYRTDSHCDVILKEKLAEHHQLLLNEPNSDCGMEMDYSLYYSASPFEEYITYENLESPLYTIIPSRIFFNPTLTHALFYIGVYSSLSKNFVGLYASFKILENGKLSALCFTYDNP